MTQFWMRLGLSLGILALATPTLCGGIYNTFSDLQAHEPVEYDYIVVGGGTSGLVVAHRLAEDRKYSVLVIEAGPTHTGDVKLQVPLWYPRSFNTIKDWNYTSIPQPGLGNRTVGFPRGHVLGGSSCLSGMATTRGPSENYDRIAAITGDERWSWNNMLPFVYTHEKLVSPTDHHDTTNQVISSAHGHSGIMGYSVPSYPSVLDKFVVQTTEELKEEFSYTPDMNAGDRYELGIGYQLSSVRNGTRENSATAYLRPDFVKGHNIDVLLNTRARKLIPLHGTHRHGSKEVPDFRMVEVSDSSMNIFNLTARKEVILSAGAIGTPQLLLLSGIGPKEDLTKLGIDVVIDNPSVGANFADHPGVTMFWYLNSTVEGESFPTPEREQIWLKEWETSRTGPLASTNTNMRGHFRMSKDELEEYKRIFGKDDPAGDASNAHLEMVFLHEGGDPKRPTFGMFVNIMTPLSSGFIKLNTSNPLAPPLIHPNLLGSQEDLYILRRGIRAALRFVKAKAWEGALLEPTNTTFVALKPNVTDDEIDKFSMGNAASQRHPLGSAAMSKKHAQEGVVDPDLKVKGASGLRIVDASIFPFVPSAHIQMPVYLMAERASDIIKEE